MSNVSGVFTQSPVEKKRYLLDYTALLALGETVTTVQAFVTSNTDNSPVLSFVVTNIAITPAGNQVTFFASGGLDNNVYEVQFIATTSLTQNWEDIVTFNCVEKLDGAP